ncbi:MAG: thiamine-monophosphate kinase [Phycisphaerae bacterium]|nr:thiamine-monophosphate kinase [Phycisphaerae bacterium]
MREEELLRRIFERSRGLPPSVVLGPGDDAAAVRTPAGDTLLLAADQVVEGRHFTPGTEPDLIARKLVARNLSDLAAMGGRPLWSLATGAIPDGFAHADELNARLFHWAALLGCPLVGGDLARTSGPMVLSMTVIGAPHPERGPVTRAGARPGDLVFVSGSLGGSFASGHHARFEPRLREAAFLCESLGARLTSMIDVSDGLGLDAARVARASGVRIEIDARRVPLSPGVTDWRAAAGDGEDHELLFTLAMPGPGVPEPACCPETGVRFSRIGLAAAGSGCVILDPDGNAHDAAAFGWQH